MAKITGGKNSGGNGVAALLSTSKRRPISHDIFTERKLMSFLFKRLNGGLLDVLSYGTFL